MRLPLFVLAAALAGCGGEVVTSPDTAPMEPFRTSHLLAGQAVALENALKSPVRQEFTMDAERWVIDARQATDTAVTMLRRAWTRAASLREARRASRCPSR